MPDKNTILLVDDTPESLARLTEILTSAGFQVRPADSGELALAAIELQHPELILLDIHLPGIGGFEVCRRLQAGEATRHIPIIFITAATEIQERLEGFRHGAADYICKPFQPEECLARLRTHLELSRLNGLLKKQTVALEQANTRLQLELTERQQAEEARWESERRYKNLVESVTSYIYRVTVKDGKAVETSHGSGCITVTGYRSEDYLADPNLWYQMIFSEDREMVMAQAQRLIAGEMAPLLEHRIVHKNGDIIWVRNTPVLHFDQKGQFVSYDGLIENITARKQAEEKLKQLQGRLELILNSTWEAILGLDLHGAITFANPAARQLLGFETQEMMGRNSHFLFHAKKPDGSHHPEEECPILTSIKADTFLAVTEDVFWRKDDVGIRVEYTCSPSTLEGRRMGGVLTFWDITQRKEAEEAFKSLVSYAPMGIYIAQDSKFVMVNPGLEAITGYRAEELLGKETLLLVTPEDKEKVRKTAIGLLKMEVLVPYEFRFIAKNGETRWVMETVASTLYKKKRAVLGYCIDVTPLKQLEGRLVQAQKMEAIGTLAGGIAHDFNNILWAIMGFTELTLHSIPEGSREHHNLQQVLKASERARDLVNQILAFSRKTAQERKPLQLASIVKEAIKLLRATIPTTIGIRTNITDPFAIVLADPTQIHQVIMNLCTNATHVMKEKGGILEVNLEECSPDHNFLTKQCDLAPGHYVMLTVRDTGQGIEPQILGRIFEPFFTTKGVGEGTGMGLAVVHGIVKSHDGDITVSSQPGEGTTFTIFLPKIVREEKSTAEVLTPIPTGRGRILVIDDESMLVNLIKEMLESLGYEAIARNSSLEALQIFRSQPEKFDLVITDQTMPQMTGMELSQEFRRIRPDMPIILCTGFSETISEEKIKAVGINELLMKPIVMRNLAEAVRKVLDNKDHCC
jgi:PAS domain S-box-containing protein